MMVNNLTPLQLSIDPFLIKVSRNNQILAEVSGEFIRGCLLKSQLMADSLIKALEQLKSSLPKKFDSGGQTLEVFLPDSFGLTEQLTLPSGITEPQIKPYLAFKLGLELESSMINYQPGPAGCLVYCCQSAEIELLLKIFKTVNLCIETIRLSGFHRLSRACRLKNLKLLICYLGRENLVFYCYDPFNGLKIIRDCFPWEKFLCPGAELNQIFQPLSNQNSVSKNSLMELVHPESLPAIKQLLSISSQLPLSENSKKSAPESIITLLPAAGNDELFTELLAALFSSSCLSLQALDQRLEF